MLRRLLTSAAALLLVAAAPGKPAQRGPGARPGAIPSDPREAQVQEVVLDNGLKVLLWDTKATPLVSVWAWYRVGSRSERPGASGLTHLVEHLTFRGAGSMPRDAMAARVDRRGGSWNGYTWLDQTAFYETATREALPDLLSLEAARMGQATLAEADFEAERSAVMAELSGSEANPAERLHREVVAAAIQAHPYHWPTLGWSTDLANVSHAEAVAHYRSWYHPANATLVVVGDFDRAATLARIRETFGALERKDTPPARAAEEPPQEGERRVVLSRPGPARHLQVSYRAPAFGDADYAAYLVADAVIAGAKGTNLWSMGDVPAPRTSRLYRRLVETGLATAASSSLVPTADPFLDSVRATIATGADSAAAESALLSAVEGLAAEVTAEEVGRAKAQLAARLVFESASVTDIAHQLGFFETIGGRRGGWRELFRLPAAVEAVTVTDVKRVAARYFRPEARTVGWYLPPASTAGAAATPSGAVAAPSGAARFRGGALAAPAPSTRAAPAAPAIVRSVLANGLTLLAVRNPLAPEVVVRVDIRAGSAWEPAEKAGLAALTARLVPAGGGAGGAGSLADAFDRAGAVLDVAVGEERAVVSARMRAGDAAALLPVLRDAVVTPALPEAALERERAAAIAEARERGGDPRAVAEATLRAALYPATDARGRDPRGSPASLGRLTRAEVADFHGRAWRPESTVIAVSGDLDPEAAIRLVRRSFGTWRGGGPKAPKPVPATAAPAAPGWIGRIHLDGAARTDVVLGWAGPARNAPEWLAVRAANTAIGEIGLGGRIGRALRDEKGLAHYAWASLEGGAVAGPYLVRAGVLPGKADEAIAAIREVLARAAEDGLTEAELVDAKTLLLGEVAHRFETNAAAAEYAADLEVWGLGVDYPRKHATLVGALTLQAVNQAAKSWIKADGIAVTAGP